MVDVEPVLERLARLLSPSGTLIVSVPVETGLPLVVKQTARRIAGWRGLGDYKYTSGYTPGEYWKSIFADDRQHIARPVYKGEDEYSYHDHKGFNWMLLRNALAARFRIEKTLSTPVSWLPPHLAARCGFLRAVSSELVMISIDKDKRFESSAAAVDPRAQCRSLFWSDPAGRALLLLRSA